MEQNILTPEQAWLKITNLKSSIDKADEFVTFLKHISKERNAKAIYLFCAEKDSSNKAHFFDAEDLQLIASVAMNQPYAEEVLTAVMNHPEFRGLDEELQSSLLSKPSLLVIYWQTGNDFCDEGELAMLTCPNWQELLSSYFSYGHGLCIRAQKKIFAQPKEQILRLVAKFIAGITEKNHYERSLCSNGFFFLLKNRPLFDLYVEKMTPFYKKKQDVLPQTIAFVARRKGWL